MESLEAEVSPFLVIHHHSGNLDADGHRNNVLKIQEDKTPSGDGTELHSDSHLGFRVRTVWRKWICFWLRRKYTSKTFASFQSESNQPAAGGGLWQSLSCPCHPRVAAGDQLRICRPAVDSLRPSYKSVSVENECFLEDGELVASRHKVCGSPSSPAKLGLFDDLFSHGRGRLEETAFSDMFQQVCSQMRLHCWEQPQNDTEELLAEEEEDEGVYGSYQ